MRDDHESDTGAIAGDPLPGAVARLATALAGARLETAPFSADAWYAYGADRGSEVVPRTVVRGREGIALGLAADLDPVANRPVVHVCVARGGDCLVEGSLVDRATGARVATWVASFQLHDGLIVRALTYRCAPVEPSASWSGGNAVDHDAGAAVHGYFRDLDAARLEDAASWFSDDVLYSHPPYWPGAARAEFRGRAELVAGFLRRGPRTNRHELTACLQHGRECLVEGYSHKPEQGTSGQFVSSLSLDEEGRIRRYVALYCEPTVGRA